MNDHDIDAMNQRALESLDRLHALGRYEGDPTPRMLEPVDEDEAILRKSYADVLASSAPSLLDAGLHSYRVSDSEALLNANQHDIQRLLK